MTLEELLNKLIKKGRVPFGDKRITNISWKMQYVWIYNWMFWSNHNVVQFWKSTRELVSKESGLWQFCVENGMIKSENWVWVNAVNGMYKEILINQYDYRYRVIESSLKDENELEDFLLSNINVDE